MLYPPYFFFDKTIEACGNNSSLLIRLAFSITVSYQTSSLKN
jgi:hypothetical protein